MITHSFAPVTTNRYSNSVERESYSALFFDRETEQDGQGESPVAESSESMEPLLNLACGCLGLMSIAGLIGVLHFLSSMWIQDCAPLDVHSLARIFGG